MADATEILKAGEKRPLWARVSLPGGTVTLQAGGKVTLTDSTGTVAGGINAAAVTGYQSTALASPMAWYLLDSTALAPGTYTLTFTLAALGSDSVTRTFTPSVRVSVVSASLFPAPSDVESLIASAGVPLPEGADVATALAAAQQEILRRLDRAFSVVTEARRYSGRGSISLDIHPCSLITAVTLLDGSGQPIYTYDPADWIALPAYNTTKRTLSRTPWLLYPGAFWPVGVANIQVSATFGEPLPANVWEAIAMSAALRLIGPAIENQQRGVLSWKEGDADVNYGPASYGKTMVTWRETINRTCALEVDLNF